MQKPRWPLWLLAWLATVLAVLVLVLANQTAVDRLLAETGLEALLYPDGKNPQVVALVPAEVSSVLVEPEAPSEGLFVPGTEGDPPDAQEPEPETAVEPEPAAEPEPLPEQANTYRLYFLKVGPDGRQDPEGFLRELPARSAPLGATIKALLLGPTLQDKALGARTEIPEGTKLLSLRLRDQTALVSLSAEFENNPGGAEGIAAAIREVVWTATQFPTVSSVQILIEGQYRDTLAGGEIRVSGPLTRTSLP